MTDFYSSGNAITRAHIRVVALSFIQRINMIGLEVPQITPKQMVGRLMVLRPATIRLAAFISHLNRDLIELNEGV